MERSRWLSCGVKAVSLLSTSAFGFCLGDSIFDFFAELLEEAEEVERGGAQVALVLDLEEVAHRRERGLQALHTGLHLFKLALHILQFASGPLRELVSVLSRLGDRLMRLRRVSIPSIRLRELASDGVQVRRFRGPDLVLLPEVGHENWVRLVKLLQDELHHAPLRVVFGLADLGHHGDLKAVRLTFRGSAVHNVADGERHTKDLVENLVRLQEVKQGTHLSNVGMQISHVFRPVDHEAPHLESVFQTAWLYEVDHVRLRFVPNLVLAELLRQHVV